MKRFGAIVVLIWYITGHFAFGQTPINDTCIKEILQSVASGQPVGETMAQIAAHFIGAPYTGGTLDCDTVERLTLNLQTFDCTTFVENVLALTRTCLLGQSTAEVYREQLTAIRYRGSCIDGYASRLHYFSDWIADNEQRGNVADISRFAGGKPDTLQLDFMTRNADRYPALQNNPQQAACIAHCEKRLSGTVFYYIPTDLLDTAAMAAIQSGDIIAFTTSATGLDIAHTGIVLRQDGEVRLLHASSSQGKVVLDSRPLLQLLRENRRFTGIRIVRPLPPSARQ